jgi:hypothetical protein
MLSVRIQGQNYRVSNETLDRLFGVDSWSRLDHALLQSRIREHHRGGRLVIDRQRLRIASPLEEAESRLRAADSRDDILRWGFLRIAAGLTQIADEIRALPVSKRSRGVREHEARLRSARPEARDAFVLAVEERLRSARPEASDEFDSNAANERLTRDSPEGLVEDRSTNPDKEILS